MPDSPHGRLAANLWNKVRLAHVLPLMESEQKAQVFRHALGVHAIFVPSDLGGRLTVGVDVHSGGTRTKLGVVDPQERVHRPDSSGVVRIDLQPGERGHGFFFANVDAESGRYSIYALFEEVGYAREKDGSPLIPWNFWYWPFAASKKDESAWGSSHLFPLQHYEQAFGLEDGAALRWEKEHHNDPEGNRELWAGHCHNATYASIFFQRPPDEGRHHAGIHLTCEELKFLATEFMGSFRRRVRVWSLPGEGYGGREGPFHYSRPNDEQEMFGAHPEVLTKFLATLREQIRDHGEALMVDLRDKKGDHHEETWNQAVYFYSTRYWQAQPRFPDIVEGLTTIQANEDFLPPGGRSSGVPAAVESNRGEFVIRPNGSGREQTMRFRLRFDDAGAVNVRSSVNSWIYVKCNGERIHAPRNAYRLLGVESSPRSGADGNPYVGYSEVLSMLSPRPRFL